MRRFDYRVPRFTVDLPVSLTQGDSTQAVRCKEISTEGMKVEMCMSFPSGASGLVNLNYGSLTLSLPVWLVRSAPDGDGLQFLYESNAQRDVVARLVACLAQPQPCTSLMLVG